VIMVLEKAYAKGATKGKVDDERFVDIPEMLQRRYDDPGKRRNVKREEHLPMEDLVLYLVGNFSGKTTNKINTACGLIATFLNDKVTHVVCAEGSTLPQTIPAGVPVVNEDFIDAVIKAGGVNNIKVNAYKFEAKKPKPVDTPKITINTDDDGMDVDEDYDNVKDELKTGTEWDGVLNDSGSKFPFKIQVLFRNNFGKVSGVLVWPTKGNSTTKFVGEMIGTSFMFREVSLISGKGNFTFPVSYQATLLAIKMTGSVSDGTKTFIVHRTGQLADTPLPFIFTGGSYSGVLIR